MSMSQKVTLKLMVEDKTKYTTVNFVLDTNVIRFKNEASNDVEKINAVKSFFEYTDDNAEIYNFVIPWQVASELRVYIYRMRQSYGDKVEFQENAKNVEDFINGVELTKFTGDQIQEENIRMLFEYLNGKYQFLYEDGSKVKANSLKTDDARILLTAIQEDTSVVTNNVKDFVSIFAFEKAIWDPVSNKIYRLSFNDATILKEDDQLKNWIEKILDGFKSNLSDEKEKSIEESLKNKN